MMYIYGKLFKPDKLIFSLCEDKMINLEYGGSIETITFYYSKSLNKMSEEILIKNYPKSDSILTFFLGLKLANRI